MLLVGNKCDMEDERVVASERGRQLSEHLGKSCLPVGTIYLDIHSYSFKYTFRYESHI